MTLTDRRPFRVLLGLALASTSLVAFAVPASAHPACDIVGTEGDDELTGTDDDDVICGLGGNDVLRGGRGHDIIIGGHGDDVLVGGPGNDLLIGGDGDDELIGRTGRDRLVGQAGDDRLEGSNGRDRLIGGADTDHCTDRRGITGARGCEIGVGGVTTNHYDARLRWDRLEVSEFVYALSETPSCLDAEPECPVAQLAPIVVRVDGGGATVATEGVTPRTADQLFAEAAAAEAASDEVAYDPELGLPVTIESESGTVVVTDIQLRDGIRSRLAEARATWTGVALADYAFTFRHLCFCSGIGPVRVTVADGEVTDAVPFEDPPPASIPDAHTVAWHLDRIEALLDGHNRSVTAAFDRRLGYPTQYSVDISALTTDDELTVEIVDFDDPNAIRIVEVAGIQVNATIADQVEALVAAAAIDGFTLAGGGYRDPSRQIELRKANCGTSEYAIWDMPASECSPPTARPGQSMHEQGLAIDFTNNGRLVTSRSEAAFVWLAANAPAYGFANHPAEPWHWSTNGN